MDYSGYYQIDGADIWNAFNLVVESGSDDFLKFAQKKESITHDWKDTNGIDVDLSNPLLNAREIQLRCAIIAASTAEFWTKYNSLISAMMQPGTRRIQVLEFGERSFFCHYKECISFDRFTRVKEGVATKVACKFTIVFRELNPQLDASDVFIVDEDGRFLIT